MNGKITDTLTKLMASSKQEYGEKTSGSLIDFVLRQTVGQSGLSLQKRNLAFKEMSNSIAANQLAQVEGTLERFGLKSEFESQIGWLQSEKAKGFIKTQIPSLVDSTVQASQLKSSVQWKPITNAPNNVNDIIKNLTDRMEAQFGVKKGSLKVEYNQGFEATFEAQRLGQQTSRIHGIKVSLPQEKISFELPFYEPSKAGMLAQARETTRTGFQGSEAIFTTAGQYLTPDKQGLRKLSSHTEFQLDLMNKFTSEVDRIRKDPKVKDLSAQQLKITEATRQYQTEVKRFHYYMADAPTLSGKAASKLGLPEFAQGVLARGAFTTERMPFTQLFSEKQYDTGSMELAKLLDSSGGELTGSSGAAGANVTIPRDKARYRSGMATRATEDMYKSLKDLSPIANTRTLEGLPIPRNIELFHDDKASLVTGEAKELFKPKANRAVVTFMDDTFYTNPLGETMRYAPEGSVVTTEKYYRQGLSDVLTEGKYPINIGGPGGVGSGKVHENINKLMELTVNKGGGSFEQALEQMTKEEMQELLQIKPGSLLGLDMQGRSVTTENQANLVEQIVGLTKTGENEITLSTARKIGSTIDPVSGQLIPVSNKTTDVTMTRDAAPGKLETMPHSTAQAASVLETFTSGMENGQRIFGAAEKERTMQFVDKIMEKEFLHDPKIRLGYMSGAAQFSLGEHLVALQQAGKSSPLIQEAANIAEGLIKSSSNIGLLKKLEDESFIQQMQNLARSQGRSEDYVKALEKQANYSLEAKLGVTADILTHGVENANVSTLQNIYALHGKFGQAINMQTEEAQKALGKTYYDLGSQSPDLKDPSFEAGKARDFATAKGMQHELDLLANQGMMQQKGSSKLASSSDILGGKTFLSLREYTHADVGGYPLGSGSRGTLEPRIFDIASLDPNKRDVMRDLTSRMTDRTPVMEKLAYTLKAEAPFGDFPSLNLYDAITNSNVIGKEDALVNMGFKQETINAFEETTAHLRKMGDIRGNTKLQTELYVPGGPEMSSMGTMITDSGLERSKEARQIYMDYMEDVNKINQIQPINQRADSLLESTVKFDNQIKELYQQQVRGTPQGPHGQMRGEVRGSAYLHNRPFGPNVEGMLGTIPQDTSALTTGQASHLENIRKDLASRQVAGKDFVQTGRVSFISESAYQDLFSDMMGQAEKSGDQKAMDFLTQQKKMLHEGKGVGSAVLRHPMIGAESLQGSLMYLDNFSAEARTEKYIRTSQQMLDIEKLTIDSKTMSSSDFKQRVVTSMMRGLGADHDGDRIMVATAGDKSAQSSLEIMMKEGHSHGMRYNAIKQIAQQSIIKRSNLQGQSLAAFKAHITSAQEELSMDVRSGAAHGAPKKITPKVSHTFTELKSMVALNQSGMGTGIKEQVFNVLEIAEQLTIGAKHLEQSTEQMQSMIGQFQQLRTSAVENAATVRADVDNLYTNLFTGDDGKLIENITYEAKNKEIININVKQTKDHLLDSISQLHQNEANKSWLSIMQREVKGETVSSEELLNAVRGSVDRVGEYTNIKSADKPGRSTAAMSRKTLTNASNDTIKAGAEAASKLPTKGIVGIGMVAAAGMLAAGGIGMVLGPTIMDKQSGGQYIDQNFLFPDQMQEKNAQLHKAAFPTPVSGTLSTPSYEAVIQSPSGNYSSGTLVGRLSSLMQGRSMGSASVRLEDHRMKMDALTISKIRNEII